MHCTTRPAPRPLRRTRRHHLAGTAVACLTLAVGLLNCPLLSRDAVAQADVSTADKPQPDAAADEMAKRLTEFGQQLSGSTWQGHFTVDGQAGDMKEERYEIQSVSKLPGGDTWLFKVRIRYGDHDVNVPLPLTVSWAGKTPVIVVDRLTIPGLGTFDARVVIADQRYAGTWQHGDVGGHLFGKIVPATRRPRQDERTTPPATESATP